MIKKQTCDKCINVVYTSFAGQMQGYLCKILSTYVREDEECRINPSKFKLKKKGV